MRYLILLFLLIIGLNASAQNLRYINHKDSVFKDLDLSGIIPLEIDTFFDAKVYLERQHKSLSRYHVDDFGYISFAHSIYSIWGISDGLESRGKKYRKDNYFYDDYENFKTVFFKNKSYFESLYKVLMPYYKQLFSEMNFQEQIAYLDVIQKGIEYAENFNLTKENKFVIDKNIADNKGKIQAFIYRRISNNEMSKKECLYWLKKIKKDLSLCLSNNKKNEPIIYEKGFADYYKCYTLKYNYKYKENAYNAEAFKFDVKESFVIKKGASYYMLDTNVKVAEYIFNAYGRPMVIKKNAKGVDTLELYGLNDNKDEYVSVNVSKDVEKVTALCYEKAESYNYKTCVSNNKIIVQYTDKTLEIINLKDKSSIKTAAVIDFVIKNEANYIQLNYVDKSTELIYFDANDKHRRFILPSGIECQTFLVWRENLLFGMLSDDKGSNQYTYGLLLSNGTLKYQPIFTDYIIVDNSFNFLLLSESNTEEKVYSAYDINLNKLSNDLYRLNIYSNYAFVKSIVGIDTSERTLLASVKVKDNKNVESFNDIVLDADAKAIIAGKWPYIKRIKPDSTAASLYFVSDKMTVTKDSTFNIVDELTVNKIVTYGKWAIFDASGKQLTDFEYDKLVMENNQTIIATKNNKHEILDIKGKSSPENVMKIAKRIGDTEFYYVVIEGLLRKVDVKNFTLSEAVYGKIDTFQVSVPNEFDYFTDSTYVEYPWEYIEIDKNILVTKYTFKNGKPEEVKIVLIGQDGKEIVPNRNAEIFYMDDNKNNYYMLSEKVIKDDYLLSLSYTKGNNETVERFQEIRDALEKMKSKFAFFDHSGKQLTDYVFDEYWGYQEKEGVIPTSKNGKTVFIDLNGKEVKLGDKKFTVNLGKGVSFNGYKYKTVLYGNGQELMAENLKTNVYRNGDTIPNVSDYDILNSLKSPAYNIVDSAFQYNWYAVSDTRNICPEGWHVPTANEWTKLTEYLGGTLLPVDKIYGIGLHFLSNLNAKDESSDVYNLYWSKSQENEELAMRFYFRKNFFIRLHLYPHEKSSVLKVRCMKD